MFFEDPRSEFHMAYHIYTTLKKRCGYRMLNLISYKERMDVDKTFVFDTLASNPRSQVQMNFVIAIFRYIKVSMYPVYRYITHMCPQTNGIIYESSIIISRISL